MGNLYSGMSLHTRKIYVLTVIMTLLYYIITSHKGRSVYKSVITLEIILPYMEGAGSSTYPLLAFITLP